MTPSAVGSRERLTVHSLLLALLPALCGGAAIAGGRSASAASSAGARREQCFAPRDVEYVPGDKKADAAFWEKRCAVLDEDAKVDKIMISLDGRIEFFKPVEGNSWCEMFIANDKHQFSDDGMTWVTPDYTTEASFFGGSASDWANEKYDRGFLTFWGSEQHPGGCCSKEVKGENPLAESWGMPFLVSSCQRCGMLAAVPGGVTLEKSYWEDFCKPGEETIPTSAKMIRVTMGSVVDYFKPEPASTICEMLMSGGKHRYSHDGTNWVRPHYMERGEDQYLLGGSAENWPRENIPGDNRRYLSFWGGRDMKGGCCGTTLAGKESPCPATKLEECFGEALTVEYC
eukprot:TRINITY_DN39195_c0_g1_i1.p1 TRINITY_DN39195_c0_g1~~TRINITY_DN39195_c0_g1_i1.p1  ORF type:complete len:343 (-),score=57.14 TRINITY_DN39195_c0_g1_i1:63-1091(-)